MLACPLTLTLTIYTMSLNYLFAILSPITKVTNSLHQYLTSFAQMLPQDEQINHVLLGYYSAFKETLPKDLAGQVLLFNTLIIAPQITYQCMQYFRHLHNKANKQMGERSEIDKQNRADTLATQTVDTSEHKVNTQTNLNTLLVYPLSLIAVSLGTELREYKEFSFLATPLLITGIFVSTFSLPVFSKAKCTLLDRGLMVANLFSAYSTFTIIQFILDKAERNINSGLFIGLSGAAIFDVLRFTLKDHMRDREYHSTLQVCLDAFLIQPMNFIIRATILDKVLENTMGPIPFAVTMACASVDALGYNLLTKLGTILPNIPTCCSMIAFGTALEAWITNMKENPEPAAMIFPCIATLMFAIVVNRKNESAHAHGE